MNELILKEANPQTDLKPVIFYVMELVGFKPENMNRESLDRMIEYIQTNFPRLSMEDFKTAFELGVRGDLEIDLNTYQNFHTLYVSNVIQAFKRYQLKQNRNQKFAPKLIERLSDWTPSEKESHFNWLLNDVYKKNHCSFPEILVCSFKDVFDYMVQKNYLKELTGENLKKRIEQIKRTEQVEQRKKGNFGDSVNSLINKSEVPSALYKSEVMEWFYNNRHKILSGEY